MHTDEYEISLLREVANCCGYILAFRDTLQRLEKKYNLASDEVLNGRASIPVNSSDRAEWIDACHALASWEKRKAEYEELHRQMKK